MTYQEQSIWLEEKLDSDILKKLDIAAFIRLIKKVENVDDAHLKSLVDDVFGIVEKGYEDGLAQAKAYAKSHNYLKKYVRKTYGFVAKGDIIGEYMAIGVGLGVAFGAAFVTFNPAFIALGLPIGIAIGLSLGKAKETELEKEEKLY